MRDKPQRVAPKLKAIRQRLGLSQTGMLRKLNLKCCYGRISEFERGKRFPSVPTLLSYARAARIPLEEIVDDEMELSI
jgi:transcriptional regulator with XRE-family HTH domain